MFNRHIQAGEHRQHIRPPGAAAAPFGVQRVADFAGELPPVEETQPLNEVDMGLEGPVDDYSYSTASRTAARIDTLRSIVQNGQHEEIDGMIVDLQTANLLIQIYEKGNDNTKNLIDTAPLEKVVGAAWKLTSGRTAVSLDAFEQEGYDAWHRDEPAAPAANKMVMDALEGVPVGDSSTIEIMKAFSRGFERGRQEMMDREFPEMKGASRSAGWVLDDLAEAAGLSQSLGNGWSVLQTNGGGPVLFREFNDYDSGKVSPPDSSGVWNWSVHARLYQVNVGSGAANTADEAMSMVEQTYAEYKRTASRTAAGKCPKCDGMGRETYETDTGSLSTQTCTACGGTGQAKEAARKTAFLDTVELTEPRHRVAGWDWDDHLNGFIAAEAAREFTCACGDNVPAPGYTDCRCGKRWNAYAISANGSKKMIAREVPVRENVVMARTASSRKQAADYSNYSYDQLVDARDILRQEYADWKIDQSEYRDTLAEIEAEAERRGLTLASRTASHRTAETINSENLQVGDVVKYGDETITIIGEQEYWQDPFGRDMMKYMARSSDGREGYVMFGYGASLPKLASTRTATRKIAAPSSGADAVAQYFPGWIVDDDDGDFWEVQSPGREHAFIHEGNGVYTLLMNDNTPDEFWGTGLTFEDALAEVRAEGII